jgi:hypothetical protein
MMINKGKTIERKNSFMPKSFVWKNLRLSMNYEFNIDFIEVVHCFWINTEHDNDNELFILNDVELWELLLWNYENDKHIILLCWLFNSSNWSKAHLRIAMNL